MSELHERLMRNNMWYDKWHKHPRHKIYHWLIFIVVSGLFTGNIIASINSSNPELILIKNIPNKEKQVAGIIRASKITMDDAAQDYILVKFKPSSSTAKRAEVMARHGLGAKSEIKQIGVALLAISPDDTPEEVVDRLNSRERTAVEFAEVDGLFPPSYIPDDPLYGSEWHHEKINSPAAWDIATGTSITIGIADSGVDATHPDLASHLVPGWNFYDNNSDTSDVYGHGTKVAGAEAAIGDNANQIVGVAWNAQIMPLRVTNLSGGGYASMIANAITYAADRGVKTVNASFGGVCSSLTVISAGTYMRNHGGWVVVSAGNSGSDPGCGNVPDLIFASATDSGDNRASFSSYGQYVDVAAPGVSILTTSRGGSTASVSGTSFSSPITAGVLALEWSANPALTADQVQQILFSTAQDLGAAGWDPYYGWGRVDAGAAVALAKSTGGPIPDSTAPTTPSNLTAFASADGTKVMLSWNPSTDNVGVTGYRVYRNSTQIGTTPSPSYTDSTVITGNTYTYTVKAYDAAGNLSGASNTATVTVPLVIKITSYSVTNKTPTTATISWTTNIPSTGSISYGLNSTNLNLSATDGVLISTHSLTLTGLTPSKRYYYKIVATNSDGSSTTNSPVSSFRTPRK